MFYEIILDRGETSNKCTIAPLEGRPDFRIQKIKGARPIRPFESSYLLHHQGTCLTKVEASQKKLSGPVGIAAIDCIWRRLDTLLDRSKRAAEVAGVCEPLKVKIPEGFVTAYPRKSTLDHDPDGGLATIEAVFIGAALLGHWDPTLLSEYYFGKRFLEINQRRFLELGVVQAAKLELVPSYVPKQRTALQRRLSRGQSVVRQNKP